MKHVLMLHTLMSIKRYILNIKIIHILTVFAYKHIMHQKARDVASRRKNHDRIKWNQFNQLLSDHHFFAVIFVWIELVTKKYVKRLRSLLVKVCLKTRSSWIHCTRLSCMRHWRNCTKFMIILLGFHKQWNYSGHSFALVSQYILFWFRFALCLWTLLHKSDVSSRDQQMDLQWWCSGYWLLWQLNRHWKNATNHTKI